MGPNVLLVVLDAVRRDALEPYGAAVGSSPTIAQLQRRGRALPSVYATSCWTVPSHASMFSGLMPRAAGLATVRDPPSVKAPIEGLRERLLASVLARAGYRTRAASANLWLGPITGFDTGFEEFAKVAATDRHGLMGVDSRRARLRWILHAARAEADDGAASLRTTIERWTSETDGRPFFWFVNLLEAHSPYLPPRPYGDVSLLDRMRAASESRRHYTLQGIWSACEGVDRPSDGTLTRMRRLYDGAVRYLDDWLGGVLEHLDAAGLLDETLVIVCSDHGENFGEGGRLAHAFSLDNRLIHVPLVMAGPGADGSEITSLAELPRLIADAIGLEAHPWQDGPPRGYGVAQFDAPADPNDAAAMERLRNVGLGKDLDLMTPAACAVRDDLKLVVGGDREQLYDLVADPLETNPLPADEGSLSPERRDAVADLRGVLRHPSMSATPVQAPAAPGRAAPSAEEMRELEERMRLLGYL